MTELHRKTIELEGDLSIAYAQMGAGPDVVLVHGALTTLEDMVLALGARLAEGFRTTAFDRPGHGGSGRLGTTGSPWRQADALRSAAQTLKLHRPVLVGHSFGGAVAMAWALAYPQEVAGVVAVAPIAFPEPRLEQLLFAPRAIPGVGRLMNRLAAGTVDRELLPALWRAMFLPQEMPERFRELFPFEIAGRPEQTRAEGEDSALLNAGLMLSAMSYWRCRVPVRIFGGDADMVVNNTLHGAVLAKLLPDGDFRRLQGLGHMAHHFAPEPIVAAVESLAPRG